MRRRDVLSRFVLYLKEDATELSMETSFICASFLWWGTPLKRAEQEYQMLAIRKETIPPRDLDLVRISYVV